MKTYEPEHPPLAITMMAGPQIMSAIIFLTTSKPVRISAAFLIGVALATIVGLVVLLAVVSLFGDGVSLGDPSNEGSIGKLIQYVLVALLVVMAVKNYVRRESVEPPRWLGALQRAEWQMALKTGLLVIWLMPGDIIVMLTVATNLVQNDVGLVAALPFIMATVLIAALPLLFYLLFQSRAQRLIPRVREWMNTQSWLLKHHRLRRVHRVDPLRISMRDLGLRSLGSTELIERSVRNFFRHPTYAAALAYRGLFGLFSFVLLVVVLLGLRRMYRTAGKLPFP
jgi:hypothetical protein